MLVLDANEWGPPSESFFCFVFAEPFLLIFRFSPQFVQKYPRRSYYGGARFQTLDGLGSAAEAGEDEGPPDEAHAEGSMRGKKGMQASPEWKAFGDHWLVLPLVELSTSSTDCRESRQESWVEFDPAASRWGGRVAFESCASEVARA